MNSIILIESEHDIQKIMNDLANYETICLYDRFKIDGMMFRKELDHNQQIRFLIDGIIRSASIEELDDLGIIIYTSDNHELSLCKNKNTELFNKVKEQSIKIMYQMIEEIRKKGIIEIVIDKELKKIDLSKIKIVLVSICDDAEELNYILDIFGDCKIINYTKKSKVLRKE